MTGKITNELIYEVLKKMQADIADIKKNIRDHDEQFKSIRHMLVAMQSDDLRTDSVMAALRSDVDRIKHRLELTDA